MLKLFAEKLPGNVRMADDEEEKRSPKWKGLIMMVFAERSVVNSVESVGVDSTCTGD